MLIKLTHRSLHKSRIASRYLRLNDPNYCVIYIDLRVNFMSHELDEAEVINQAANRKKYKMLIPVFT